MKSPCGTLWAAPSRMRDVVALHQRGDGSRQPVGFEGLGVKAFSRSVRPSFMAPGDSTPA